MNLRFALLAALSSRPRTGYALVRIFDRSVDYVWHAPHPRIYLELRRMEQDGLVDVRELPRGERGIKREYRLSDAGLAELRQQASTPHEPARERDPYRLKAAYGEFADPAATRRQFELLIEHWQRWRHDWEDMRQRLEDRTDPILSERLAGKPDEEHDVIVAWKVFAYEGLIARAEMEIAWARRGLALLKRLHRPRPA